MLVELDCSIASEEQIVSEFLRLSASEFPLVLRHGLQFLELKGWENLLEQTCGWTMDRRHFEPDENAEEAVADTYTRNMDWWEISYQPKLATSYAFSNTRQPFHTDYAWFHDGADIDFDAMIKQARSGGEQMFYPVSRIVSDLADAEPGLLHDLSTLEVKIAKGDGQDANQTTVLKEDPAGGHTIAWNYYRIVRSSKAIDGMCEAFFAFLEQQEATTSVHRIRCNDGDCFALSDSRQLHGRQAFEANKPFDRVLLQSGWWSQSKTA